MRFLIGSFNNSGRKFRYTRLMHQRREVIRMKFLQLTGAFRRRFSTDEKCLKHILKVRVKSGFNCPRCGGTDFRWIKGRNAVRCSKHRNQLNILKDTAMYGSPLPLYTWFWAAYIVTRFEDYSIAAFQRDEMLSRWDTAKDVIMKLKQRRLLLKKQGAEVEQKSGDMLHKILGLSP